MFRTIPDSGEDKNARSSVPNHFEEEKYTSELLSERKNRTFLIINARRTYQIIPIFQILPLFYRTYPDPLIRITHSRSRSSLLEFSRGSGPILETQKNNKLQATKAKLFLRIKKACTEEGGEEDRMVKRKPVASLRECSLKAIPRFRVLTVLIKEIRPRDFSPLGIFMNGRPPPQRIPL